MTEKNDLGEMEKNISELYNSAKIVLNAAQYNVASDHRVLIPYI